jgi:hypothetical protein
VAGWIAVSLGGFYKVGDRVELGGIRGDVVDIGFLRTTLFEVGEWVDGDLYNGRVVRVANSFIFKEPVVNYSGDFPFLWDELHVPVKGAFSTPCTLRSKTRRQEVLFSDLEQGGWGDQFDQLDATAIYASTFTRRRSHSTVGPAL